MPSYDEILNEVNKRTESIDQMSDNCEKNTLKAKKVIHIK